MFHSLALAVLILAFSWPALAEEPNCLPRGEMILALAQRYNEVRVVRMLAGRSGDTDRKLVEIFVGPSRGWSLTVTTPDDKSCLIGSGDGFEIYLPIRGPRT